MQNIINELSKSWQSSGIKIGDTVLLHSNIKRTIIQNRKELNKNNAIEVIFESFKQAVGEEGTIIFPIFNFDFCSGVGFDYNKTPSQMGALTEYARLTSLASGDGRSKNPIYGFVAFGKYAEAINKIDNKSGYGEDSVFAWLHKNNGKIAVLNLPDQNSMTFYHYVEEMNLAKYRYFKDFTAKYINENGISNNKTYKNYVRDIENGVLTDVNNMGEILWKNNIYTGSKQNEGNGLRVAKAKEIYNATTEVIRSGNAEGTLFSHAK